MTDKQASEHKTNPVTAYNTILLYNSQPTLAQYLMFNMFRILRPLRLKYSVTINELLILTGMVTYFRFVSSSFSASSIRHYIKYWNDRKINYYIKSLQEKECIILADIYNGYNRYKITTKGIEIIEQLDSCYNVALNKFIVDNGINV